MVKTDLNQSVWKAGQANLPPAERQEYAIWAEEKIRKVSPLGRWQTPPEFAARDLRCGAVMLWTRVHGVPLI